MAYVEEFRNQLAARDYSKVMQLWHEYCQGDLPDGQEIIDILTLIKQSDFAKPFGQYVEAILPLALLVEDEALKLESLRHIFDLETTNSEALFTIAEELLKSRFSSDPTYNEKIRLIGMRNRDNFQGALSNYLLLNHIQKGNFVLHTAGWGIGEIMDFSSLREQVSIEFENLGGGKKEISFKNAFKTLVPIGSTHFLARRFAEPDALEAEAREHPVRVIHSLLSDLGPKTAAEIKDLFVEAIIPEEDYSKWWQQARAKLKKDPMIESPDNPKLPFRLRKGSVSAEDRVQKAFHNKQSFQDVLTAAHNLVRDFPEILREPHTKELITSKVKALIERPSLSQDQLLQALLFLEHSLGYSSQQEALKNLILNLKDIDKTLESIEVIALKKRLLTQIRLLRSDWKELYLKLLFTTEPNTLRDYILKELKAPETLEELKTALKKMVAHPKTHPEALVWYFQKIIDREEEFFQTQEGRAASFEGILILFHALDTKSEARDLSKKMYNLLTNNRFEVVRNFLKDSDIKFAHEFLLLASKCQGFSDHEQKILRSLAEVVHPKLVKDNKEEHRSDHNVIWTTQEGYTRIHDRIKQIGTVEIVENAREVEVARAHGDLRENAEYKAAVEKRSRLQSELKDLSEQFKHSRILTKDDISSDAVGVGVIVQVADQKGQKAIYTILGPWDADPDKGILSMQSKLAQAMLGKKAGEAFAFKNEEYKILSLKSYLN